MLYSEKSELYEQSSKYLSAFKTFSILKNPIAIAVAHFKVLPCFVKAKKNLEFGSNYFSVNFENHIKLRTSVATMCVSFISKVGFGKHKKFSDLSSKFFYAFW